MLRSWPIRVLTVSQSEFHAISFRKLRRENDAGPDAEARRQSLLVREHESEREVLRFISEAADLKGWE